MFSLYINAFLLCNKSKEMHTIERKLQQFLNKIKYWATENGFRFTETKKSNSWKFLRKRKLHNDPTLKYKENKIPVIDSISFWG